MNKDFLKPFARNLRNDMTTHEQIIWSHIRRRQILNVQFYRQKILGPYIVDFYAPCIRLVLEIDGAQHLEDEYEQQDKLRDEYFNIAGIHVQRFSNGDVSNNTIELLEELYFVISELKKELKKSPRLRDGPL